jgi:group I intron endonuclease
MNSQMEFKHIVYKVTSPNGKVYIGLTSKTLEQRKKDHINMSKKRLKSYFYNALKKYNEQLVWEELIFCNSREIASELEKFFIKQYQSYDPNKGYNGTFGGDNKVILTEEVKQKISNTLKGRKHSLERIQNIKNSKLGKPLSEKQILGNKNRHIPHKKSVICNETKEIFESIDDASRHFKGHRSQLSEHLSQKRIVLSFKGYTFSYLESSRS